MMVEDNIILMTDSYKLCHFDMYPDGTENVYSYFECRKGAEYDHTLFFGLQYLLQKYLEGTVLSANKILEAQALVDIHMGPNKFNLDGWWHILTEHDGCLPLRIKAVPEGSIIPVDNILMSVENTCPQCYWLTNYVETLLTHVWYSSTVATKSWFMKQKLKMDLESTGSDPEAINFMLHDFGYRGATSNEAAAIGGAGHLVNFMGTDTVPALALAINHYDANPETLGFSVPATEHSIMTALGREGEIRILDRLLDQYPTGILSVVADSYNIYSFVDEIISRKDQILARDGRFVVRPDSVTPEDKTPQALSYYIVSKLWAAFGKQVNEAGWKVLDPHIRVLWGDGIDEYGISDIMSMLKQRHYAAENMIFGMGGGLLQRGIHRDVQRFAFKSSAQKRNGKWHDIQKIPLDLSKKSKAGRLMLHEDIGGHLSTVPEDTGGTDLLKTIFENGEIVKTYTFDEIRDRSNA